MVREDIRNRLRQVAHAVRDILYGMTTYDWARDLRRERGEVERLFVLVTFGDIVGIPFCRPTTHSACYPISSPPSTAGSAVFCASVT